MIKIRFIPTVQALALSVLLAAPVASFAAPVCTNVFAAKPTARRAVESQLRIAPGRQVDFAYAPAKAGFPTFVFMPGVNRGMTLADPAVRGLTQAGFGAAVFNFSSQPFSISKLPPGEKAYSKSNEMTMEDFANEANHVINHLRQQGVQEIIPVSLSFSGGVSPLIKDVPLIIETVPMTNAAAALGQRNSMSGLWMPWIIRMQVDAAYRMSWGPQVDKLIKAEGLDPARRDEMVEGYVRMSQATEGFSWKVKELPKETKRIFIVAEKETPTLLRSQLETYLEYREMSPDALLFLVKDSGHIVVSDQPGTYAMILYKIANNEVEANSGVFVYEPSTNKIEHIKKENAKDFIDSVIRNL